MKTYEYKLQGDGRDSWKCIDSITGDIYMVYERPLNWRGLTEGLYASNVFILVLTGQLVVSSVVYSTLTKMLTDGEDGNCAESKLLQVLQILTNGFDAIHITEINTLLENNMFTVRL